MRPERLAIMAATGAFLAGAAAVTLQTRAESVHRIGTVVAVVAGTQASPSAPSPARLAEAARSAVRFWESAGAPSFSRGEVVAADRIVRLPVGCDQMPPSDEVLEGAARAAGLDLNALDHLVVYLSTAPCAIPRPFARASVGERIGEPSIVWLNGPRPAVLSGFIAHELGHNLGLGHADRQVCEEGNCVNIEYGDPWAIMAVNYLADGPTAAERAALGVNLPAAMGANRLPIGSALMLTSGQHLLVVERDGQDNVVPCPNPVVREIRADGSTLLLDPYGRTDPCAGLKDGQAAVMPGGTSVTFRSADGGWLFVG